VLSKLKVLFSKFHLRINLRNRTFVHYWLKTLVIKSRFKIIKIVIFLLRTLPVSWKKLDYFSSGFSLACITKNINMENTKPLLEGKFRDGYTQKRT
jgi:hypothetical protein